jgi:outer membrane protein assembly factor BamE (lipoprotein component of BamABCDE complex)
MARFRSRSIRAVALAGLLGFTGLGLAGCSLFDAPRDTRGARLDPEVVKELVPGVQTRRDVLALLGTPSVTPAFDDITWYYIGGTTRQRVGRQQALEAQEVVAVHFTLDGVIEKVETLSLADAQSVQLVSRATPTPGTERNLMQQLFGNIGRFGTGAQRTPGGGSGGGLGQ